MPVESSYEAYLRGLPPDWNTARICDIAKVVGGGTPSRDVVQFWDGAIPWVTPGEISAEAAARLSETRESISRAGLAGSGATLLPAGSLMITTRATLGVRAINAVPMTTNQGFKSLIFGDPSDAPFYYYVTEKLKTELKRRASGTTFLEVSGTEFGQIEVPVPPITERALIAQALDTLDTTIRQTEAIIEKLKLVKQGLLHDLLTRGVDANGELRPPQREAPHLYKESPLGWIPRNWASPPIQNAVAESANGASIRADEFRESGTPVIAKGDVTYAKFIDTSRRIQFVEPTLAAAKYKGSMIDQNFIVCSMRDLVPSAPTLGMASLLDADMRGLLAQGTTALRLDDDRFEAELFVEVTRLPWFRKKMRALAVGSTQVHMRGGDYLNVSIPAPPREEQREIVTRVRAIDRTMRSYRETSTALDATKYGLMDDLLTGRVRVTPLLAQ